MNIAPIRMSEPVIQYRPVPVMIFKSDIFEETLHEFYTFKKIFLVILMNMEQVIFYLTLPDQVLPVMAEYVIAIGADIEDIGVHHGTGGDDPLGEDTMHALKKRQHFIPLLRAGQLHMVIDIVADSPGLPQHILLHHKRVFIGFSYRV